MSEFPKCQKCGCLLFASMVLLMLPFFSQAYTIHDNGIFIERDRLRFHYEITGAQKGDYFKLYIIGKNNERLFEKDYDCENGKQSLAVLLIQFKAKDIQGYYVDTDGGRLNRIFYPEYIHGFPMGDRCEKLVKGGSDSSYNINGETVARAYKGRRINVECKDGRIVGVFMDLDMVNYGFSKYEDGVLQTDITGKNGTRYTMTTSYKDFISIFQTNAGKTTAVKTKLALERKSAEAQRKLNEIHENRDKIESEYSEMKRRLGL